MCTTNNDINFVRCLYLLLHVDGDNTEILTKLMEQQQQILNILTMMTNPPPQATPQPITTQNIQETSITQTHQLSSDHSTLEELLNTTTDEELDFLNSPSWSSPHFSGTNTSDIPAVSSLQSPPLNSMAQTPIPPATNMMYQLPPQITPVTQQLSQSSHIPEQTRCAVNWMTQPYPQPSSSNSYSQASFSNSCSQPFNPLTPPQKNEPVPASLLPPPFSTPPKLLPVDEVMRDHPGNDIFTLRRLTTALARDAIFGKQALGRSSLSGKNNTGCLEKRKLEYIKALVRSRVPTMSDVTFEAIWAKCHSSLSKSCQILRTTAKKEILT